MTDKIRSLCAAALLVLAGPAAAADIDVMTQNQYLGADLTPVLTADSPAAANAAIVQALENVAASLPAQRLSRLAELIKDRSAHVVVLNEAFAYECDDLPGFAGPGIGCDNQRIKGAFIDFLGTTTSNLAGRYVLKSHVQNFAVEQLTFLIDGVPAQLTVRDRDAILVRSDVADDAAAVNLAGSGACRPSLDGEGCNYFPAPVLFNSAIGPIAIERGFAAVDLQVAGQPYRVFGTHLEVRQLVPGTDPFALATRALQRMQAEQLRFTAEVLPAAAGTRTLVVGDINSAEVDGQETLLTPIGPLPPPYEIFAADGYFDTWKLRPGATKGNGAPLVGFSCCQDEDLGNHQSSLYERIDIIFSKDEPTTVRDARLLGESVADKTAPQGWGVWPSDHASVAARIRY